MPIGYYNFGNIEQGNQFAANQLAGIGQQIGQAISTHAQTQAAQAMLPALQESYAQGMQKIASGDPNGLADIYSASATASQVPILAKWAQNAITTGTSANINAQHMARTQAYLQGRGLANMAAHPEMYNPDGTINTSRLGQSAQPKPMTAYQQQSIEAKNAGMRAKQVGLFSNLWNGLPATGSNPSTEGASTAYSNILQSISNGKAPSQDDLNKFAGAYSQYQQTRNALGNVAIQDQNFENAYQQIKQQVPKLNDIINTEKAKGTGHILGGLFGTNTNDSVINSVKNQINQIQQLGGSSAPSEQSGMVKGTNAQALMQAMQAAKLHPDKLDLIKGRLKDANIDPSLLDEAMKSGNNMQQNQQQSAPQTSTMLPAVNQIASAEGQIPETTETGEMA
jgi:hypothetical protein